MLWPPTIPGSGILATTFPASMDSVFPASRNHVGDILVETPRGDIRASAGGVVQIWVDDEGLGIPEDEREVVFDAFYRSPESRASKGDGSGLGLAIARAIAIGHGGSLRVHDAPSGGARLQLELPARRGR